MYRTDGVKVSDCVSSSRDSTPGSLMLDEEDCTKENGGDWQKGSYLLKLALGSCLDHRSLCPNSKRYLPIPSLFNNAAMLYVLGKFLA